MSKNDEAVKTDRRNFLKLAAVSAPAVAVAAATGTAAQAVEVGSPNSGLQDTAHTQAYFETAAF
ncbi:MAG: twin-arginine translocation pathway signal protein [Rhodobacteraceae bacterium]|nr:twin-arginine translocation pathway signal protein [Paracoccaceae bacterium]